MRALLAVVCLVLAVAVAGGAARDARIAHSKSRSAGVLQHTTHSELQQAVAVGFHAKLISHINRVMARARVEQSRNRFGGRAGARAKGSYCKVLFSTTAVELPQLAAVISNRLTPWIPAGQKTLSVFFQGEVSAKAFVGLSANVGVGFEVALDAAAAGKIVGAVRFFGCLGASVTVGTLGATASAGLGILVGFGQFSETVLKANVELGVSVGFVVGGGVSVLFRTDAPAQDNAQLSQAAVQELGVPPDPKNGAAVTAGVKSGYYTKALQWLKDVAKGTKMAAKNLRAVGVHLFGGHQVGGAVELRGTEIVSEYDTDFTAAISSWLKTRSGWLSNTKMMTVLRGTLESAGKASAKFDKKWKITASDDVHQALDSPVDLFDDVELTAEQVGAELQALQTPDVGVGRRGGISMPAVGSAEDIAAKVGAELEAAERNGSAGRRGAISLKPK